MPNYRDVDAGLRIGTLEAKLAERDAALAARDAELQELRAGLAGAGSSAASVRARRITRIVAVAGVFTSVAFGLAFASARAAMVREQAYVHDTIEMSRSHQAYVDGQLTRTKEMLLACTQQNDPAQRPPPPPFPMFGEASDRASIEAALDAAAASAATCVGPHHLKGTARVRMIFDSLHGRVESATLDFGPFSGIGIDDCLLAPFRGMHVDAFKGARVTLTKEITVR